MRCNRTVGCWLVAVTLLAASGCRVSLPNNDLPLDSNAELIEHIAYMPYVTADAAWRSLYILKFKQVHQGSFEEVATELAAAGFDLPDLAAGECPDRTEVAAVFHRICDVPAGLNYTLTGLGRYALRDLQYARIVRTPRDYGPLTGGEFLGLLARAEEALQHTGETIELGEEPR